LADVGIQDGTLTLVGAEVGGPDERPAALLSFVAPTDSAYTVSADTVHFLGRTAIGFSDAPAANHNFETNGQVWLEVDTSGRYSIGGNTGITRWTFHTRDTTLSGTYDVSPTGFNRMAVSYDPLNHVAAASIDGVTVALVPYAGPSVRYVGVEGSLHGNVDNFTVRAGPSSRDPRLAGPIEVDRPSIRCVHASQLARALGTWRRRPHAPGLDLEDALRDAVLLGRIAVAARLPSERGLAAELGLSRGTVSAAYGRLRDGGWVTTRTGAGSVTALPGTLNARLAAPGGWRSRGDDAHIDLAYAAPIAPLPEYLEALETASERLRGLALEPVVSELEELQEAIADRYRASGLATSADQVVLTGGASAGLVLGLRDVAPPGSRLLVESPTYPGALEIAAQHGAQLIGWPMLDGWDADAFVQLADRHRIRAAYVTFDFHNPTGALADPEERARIVRLARERDIALIVDETLRDLAFVVSRAPAPTVGATLHLGSLSKSVWAGLRVGWIRARDTRAADRLRVQARQQLDGDQLLERWRSGPARPCTAPHAAG